ncbi:hypothetical protein UK23_15345 [Lentzea aerocolonigenes]|uniref:DUF4232 domain-containing protein n=1 Tax=Lentzea aerocolonigenes TaxID=68170 RepID=A0A0F0H5X3_LENAE|nr:hypothetical protein UK23_15345 [Lentzea aerocolonigenes]
MTVTGTVAAQAETSWCTGSDLVISAHRMNKPSANATAHWMRFAPAEGASCKIGGSLSNVRFLDAGGRDMNIPLAGGQTGHYVEVPVGGIHEAAVYVGSEIQGPTVTPAYMMFNLPGQNSLGDLVLVKWPSSIGTIVRVGDLTPPVG